MTLQWSHGLSAMDTCSLCFSSSAILAFLQWSHGLSAMDTPGRRLLGLDDPLPSMEPWPLSHGYQVATAMDAEEGDPSMEPWPLSHGYVAACSTAPGSCAILQWSHGLSAMDTSHTCGSTRNTLALQWSHGLSAMDTPYPPSRAPDVRSSFNGAMASQPWIPFHPP